MPVLDLFKLDGHLALVTGASRGIGLAIACGLAEAGATVYGVGRSNNIESDKDIFHYHSCDVRDSLAVNQVITEIMRHHHRLDILVNAAGISLSTDTETEPLSRFQDTIALNLTSAFECCCLVLPHMVRNHRGSIINITSINATLGFPDNPGYVASKGGLAAMTRALAADYGTHGIRVNNLVPGYVNTAMTQASHADPKTKAERANRTMLRRWASPNELAGAAVFLASPASSYVTGSDLVIDGGWLAKGL